MADGQRDLGAEGRRRIFKWHVQMQEAVRENGMF